MTESGRLRKYHGDAVEQPTDALVSRPPRLLGLEIAGAMTFIAGILCVVNGVSSVLRGASIEIGPHTGEVNISVCGFIVVLLGSISLAGGIAAYLKKHISLAIAGAVAGMIGGGIFGFWLGLASLLLIALSNADI